MDIEVTEKEFYTVIKNLDVTVTPMGNYPYRTDFRLRNNERVGYIQDIDLGGIQLSKYYLCR